MKRAATIPTMYRENAWLGKVITLGGRLAYSSRMERYIWLVLVVGLAGCSSSSVTDGGVDAVEDADGVPAGDDAGEPDAGDDGGDLEPGDDAGDQGDEPIDPEPGDGGDENGDDAGHGDDGGDEGAGDDGGVDPCQQMPPVSRLPFSYTRPDVGTPLTLAELEGFTDAYLALLEDTRYFTFVEERVHGWPESDPQGRYWYGTWWSGVTLQKRSGQITYRHIDVGGDNNGLRTAPILEGTCYAYLMWNDPEHEHLTRKMVRGFSSWILGMEQTGVQTPTLMTRAAYLENIQSTDDGRSYFIDYSQNRPGVDNSATEYVNIPNNPYWGDIWIKNKRSKDCIGEMYRAVAQMRSCQGCMSTAGEQDLEQMFDLYASWSRQVEDDGWGIATYDKDLSIYIPMEDLARFVLIADAECAGVLALRFLGRGDPGTLDCEDGISWPEDVAFFNNDLMKSGNKQMLRSYHQAAISFALDTGHDAVALALIEGMADRLDRNMDYLDQNGQLPDNLDTKDLVTLIVEAATVGVPLTSREVRWVHQQIGRAAQDYLAPGWHNHFHVFDAAVPDGDYFYKPGSDEMLLNDFGLPLGACASIWRNPASRQLLDCDRVLTSR